MYKIYLTPLAMRDKRRLRTDIEDAVETALDDLAIVDDFRRNLHKPLEFKPAKLRRARPPFPGSDYRIIWQQGMAGKIEVLAIWRRDQNTYTHDRLKGRLPSNLQSDDWTEWCPTALTVSVAGTENNQPENGELAYTAQLGTKGILDNILDRKLTPSQQAILKLNATGPVLVRGVAGSGKTALGLRRAHHIAELRANLGQDTSILMLTRTRALKTALTWLFLNGFHDLLTEIDSFGDWMLERLQESGHSVAENNRSRDVICRIRAELTSSHPMGDVLSTMSSSLLLDEINDVIRGRDIRSLEEYKQIKRSGRRRGLNQSRRELVWVVYQKYLQALRKHNMFDWAELPQLVMEHCRPLPRYDVVIVDEAQDMRPNYLSLATKLVKDYKEHRSVTLLGDSAQSIQYQGISWRDAKLPLRGSRTRVLRDNHRSSRRIMNIALPILEKCKRLGNVRRHHAPANVGKDGEKPVLVRYTSLNRAVEYIAQEIDRLSKTSDLNLDFSNFAILSPRKLDNSDLFDALWRHLPQMEIPCRHFRDEDFMAENEVGLVTMQSATGLEFPVVFIIDFEEGILPYTGSSSTPLEQIEERGRKLAYVSMTRASERLYLVYSKSNPSRFVHDILEHDKNAVQIVDA